MSRREGILSGIAELLTETAGLEVSGADTGTTFIELGLDSLFLTQFAIALGNRFKVKIAFRSLLEHYPTMDSLADHLAANLPAEAATARPATVVEASGAQTARAAEASSAMTATPATLRTPLGAKAVRTLIEQQLQIMAQQLALLGGAAAASSLPLPASPGAAAQTSALPEARAAQGEVSASSATDGEGLAANGGVTYDAKKAFGAIARIHTARGDELTPRQKARLTAFVRRYNARTAGSKRFAQENRAVNADPRVVTGFRPAVKELVYPIVTERSAGSKLWDIDGNEYVDALNGFGMNMFGWQPPFVTNAIKEQLELGYEIGPQHRLSAEVARLICEFTGFDRAGFCNTGSEAVMGCMRIARTVTGRRKIAIFSGSYHGIFDEVLVRGTKKLRAIPAAPGIMPASAENVLVLDYGTDESLEILKAHAHELAAILVEPVQSRRPDFQPRAFLHALRELTTRHGIVYIFDEVVTGFRASPGGAQEFFGVRADLASYGKVIGGGLPIGAIAGKAEFMDALDGGHWQFGDDSVPPVGVTYFAGTFVRHPLALAAAKASLLHLKERGPHLQSELSAKTAAYVEDINSFVKQVGAPIELRHFGSLWKTFFTTEQPFNDLLFYMLRDRGVHIYDGFPCFFTTAHSSADVAHMANAFKESVVELQEAGFLAGRKPAAPPIALDASMPPVPGARLGRDPSGNPAWYVPDPAQPERYVKLESH